MERISGMDHHSANLNWTADSGDPKVRVARDSSTRKIVKSEAPDFGYISYRTVAEKPNGTKTCEERCHYFAAMGRIVRMPTDLLQNDNGRLGRLLYGLIKLYHIAAVKRRHS